MCRSASLQVSTLAVTITSERMLGLLHVPETAEAKDDAAGCPAGQYLFDLPSPEALLSQRIHRATALGLPCFLHCAALGGEDCARAAQEHAKAGFPLYAHPESTAVLGIPSTTESGSDVLCCPDGASPVQDSDYPFALWRGVSAPAGLPQAQNILVSALEHGLGLPPSDSNGPARQRLKGRLFPPLPSGGLPLDVLAREALKGEMLRLRAIQRMTGLFVADHALACIFGLLALPTVSERSCREGVTLIHVDDTYLRVALVFQERLAGFLELPASASLFPASGEGDMLMKLLDEFRLGWLPGELAASFGGMVELAPSLPPEAEGFRPIFVAGPQAHKLQGRGRLLEAPDKPSLACCQGLLHAYARSVSPA